MDLVKSDTRQLKGIGASAGIAIGQVRIAERRRVTVTEHPVPAEGIPGEIVRLARRWSGPRPSSPPSGTSLP